MSSINKDLSHIRDVYNGRALTSTDLDADAIAQFDNWFDRESVN